MTPTTGIKIWSGPFLDLDHLIAPLKEPWSLIANRWWVGCGWSQRTGRPILTLIWAAQTDILIAWLSPILATAWQLDLNLIPVAGDYHWQYLSLRYWAGCCARADGGSLVPRPLPSFQCWPGDEAGGCSSTLSSMLYMPLYYILTTYEMKPDVPHCWYCRLWGWQIWWRILDWQLS